MSLSGDILRFQQIEITFSFSMLLKGGFHLLIPETTLSSGVARIFVKGGIKFLKISANMFNRRRKSFGFGPDKAAKFKATYLIIYFLST